MNTSKSLQKGDPNNVQNSSSADEAPINPFPIEKNRADGGEFLDDNLRMKDQPLKEPLSRETSTPYERE
jgi:hypothetical protein